MSSSRVIRNQRSLGHVVVPIENASAVGEHAKSSYMRSSPESAESQMSKARQKASEILEQARDAAEDIRRRAYDEGYTEGKEQGSRDALEEYQSKLDEAVQSAAELVHTAQAQRSALIGSLGDVLTELVMTALDSLLHRPDAAAHADVTALVDQLLEDVRSADVEVRVHPDDYADVVSRCKIRFDGTTQQVMVVPDNAVTRGGCIVVTGSEEIDASLETSLELLVPIVKRAVGRVLDERTVGVFSGV